MNPRMSLVSEILALAGLVIVFEIALALWVGASLERAAIRAEEAGCERPLDSSVRGPAAS
jgi:hypothetical protein